MIQILFISLFTCAQINLFKRSTFEPPQKKLEEQTAQQKKQPTPRQIASSTEARNLPNYFNAISHVQINDNVIVTPTQKVHIISSFLRVGELYHAQIKESLMAFSEGKIPVRAVLKDKPDCVLLGESSLERASKRILVVLNKIRCANQVWSITAHAIDHNGYFGIEGTLVSREDKYFAAELLSAGAAGFVDATVERNQTAIGTIVERPSLDTASKRALGTALMRSAERFADKIKNLQEYVHLKGPVQIKILVTDQPKLLE